MSTELDWGSGDKEVLAAKTPLTSFLTPMASGLISTPTSAPPGPSGSLHHHHLHGDQGAGRRLCTAAHAFPSAVTSTACHPCLHSSAACSAPIPLCMADCQQGSGWRSSVENTEKQVPSCTGRKVCVLAASWKQPHHATAVQLREPCPRSDQ